MMSLWKTAALVAAGAVNPGSSEGLGRGSLFSQSQTSADDNGLV